MVSSIVFLLISIQVIDKCHLPLGKVYARAYGDITGVIACLRYYAGWADKVQGKTVEVTTSHGMALKHVLNIRDRPMKINLLTRGMNHMALWYVYHLSLLFLIEPCQGQITPWNFPLVCLFIK